MQRRRGRPDARGEGLTPLLVWYNSRPMLRRGLSVTLLVLIAVQLLGSMAFASVCLEPCPDDTEETSCPPVCALCTSCTHSQTAIVPYGASETPLTSTHRFVAQPPTSPTSQLAAEIFHVPLLG
jgi:hypothetical protein